MAHCRTESRSRPKQTPNSITKPSYLVAGWSPALCHQLAGLPPAPPGTEHLTVLYRLLCLFLALYGDPPHKATCLGLFLWSFSPSLYLTSQRERCWPKLNTPFQERKYHYTGIMSERDPSAVLKWSMSLGTSGFCSQSCSRFSLKFGLLTQRLYATASLPVQMAVIFSLHLKTIGVVKDLDT